MPPVPTAGNPFLLQRGNCIAFIGINPRWHDNDDSEADRDCKRIRECIDDFPKQEDRYHNLRAGYFDEDSKIYYWRYFTRPGRFIGEKLLGKTRNEREGPTSFAKRIFRSYVFKADFLPWFSRNTAKIDTARVASSKDDALVEHHNLLKMFLLALEPRWIQCNGLQMEKVAEEIFNLDGSFEKLSIGSGKKILCGWGKIVSPINSRPALKVPILMHGFTTSQRGIQSDSEQRLAARKFQEWVGDASRFGFS